MAATAELIQLSLRHTGVYNVGLITQELADVVNQGLMRNHHDNQFTYSSYMGIFQHNHVAHHLITLFALGDTPEHVRKMFTQHNSYQKEQPKAEPTVYREFDDEIVYMRHVGDDQQYGNFMHFFAEKIARMGMERAVQRYVFAGDKIADDMICRLLMGFLHPLIHLGFAIEFDQPALVAEALAQAVSHHDDYIIEPLRKMEERSNAKSDHQFLAEILDACTADEELIASRKMGPDLLEALLRQLPDRVIDLASRWIVHPTDEDIALKAAELLNASCYAVAGCQRPGKAPRIDFLLLHLPNTSLSVSSIAKASWLSNEHKARLLSYYGRMLVAVHLLVGAGADLPHGIQATRTLKPLAGGWEEARLRGVAHPDDGHAAKVIRSVAYAERESQPYEGRPGFRMRQDDFLLLATATILSLNPVGGKAGLDTEESWIRFAGMDSAWEQVPPMNTAWQKPPTLESIGVV